MGTYRVTPTRRGYRIEQLTERGEWELVRIWPTEREAVSDLRALQDAAEAQEALQRVDAPAATRRRRRREPL